MLAPPPPPAPDTRGRHLLVLGSLLGLGGLAAEVMRVPGAMGLGLLLLSTAGVSGWGAARAAYQTKRRMAREERRWREVMMVWDRLCYCSQCERVFDPARGVSVPLDQIQQLLLG